MKQSDVGRDDIEKIYLAKEIKSRIEEAMYDSKGTDNRGKV